MNIKTICLAIALLWAVTAQAAVTLTRLTVEPGLPVDFINLYGTFPESAAGITISQKGTWLSFIQYHSGVNELQFPVDASLPSGNYEVTLTISGEKSNALAFSVGEKGTVIPIPAEGATILPEPDNDRRPILMSYSATLIAGQSSVVQGQNLVPGTVVRLEGSEGDVIWARRVTPSTEGVIEFVVPTHHYGGLVLVVDNGIGVTRRQVEVVSPPAEVKPPSPGTRTHPEVLAFKFIDMGPFGPMRCSVVLDEPMSGDDLLLFLRREDAIRERSETTVPAELILMLAENPDADFLANIQRDIARFREQGGTLHAPYVERGINVLPQGTTYLLSFVVPPSFAAHGVEWLNAAEEHDEHGFVTGKPFNVAYDMD